MLAPTKTYYVARWIAAMQFNRTGFKTEIQLYHNGMQAQ